MNTKIILLGYMGSGKSTIGQLLAQKKQLRFIDLDTFIEEKEQNSVPEIFKTKGEIYFRKKEREYLNEILNLDESFVLALGGGTPCFGDTMQHITQKTPHTFYLCMTAKMLTLRLIPEKHKRPLVAHLSDEVMEEFINKHLFERNPFYRQANFTLHIDTLSPSEIVTMVEEKL